MKQLFLNISFLCTLIILMFAKGLQSQNPNWQRPEAKGFSKTANAISIIYIDGVRSDNLSDRIAFFVGNEIRGLSNPVAFDGGFLHFTTIYSNASAEPMTIKVYRHNTMTVYDIANSFSFETFGITGSTENPMIINGYQDNDAPISILPIPQQSTLFGLPYSEIDLNDFLVQPDPTPVTWSYNSNPLLNVTLDNGMLNVTGLSGLQGDQTLLTVQATEATGKMASRQIVFRLVADFPAPSWMTIPNQSIPSGTQFDTIQLDSFEVDYVGDHLIYNYRPIIEQALDTVANPLWVPDTNNKNTMTIIAQVKYTPNYTFNHPQDKLIATVNGLIKGMSRPNKFRGKYHLSVGGVPNGSQIKFQFYSGLKKQVLNLLGSIPFQPYGILGSNDSPIILDFAPLVPSILPNGETKITIRDTSWRGLETFEFIAADSRYPMHKFDKIRASFCIVNNLTELDTFYQDADSDGLGNPLVYFLACVGKDGYVTNGNDCNDNGQVDPSFTVAITETSGPMPNDGNLCVNGSAVLSVTGAQNYLWNTGATTNAITVTPAATSEYIVTVTPTGGTCQNGITFEIYVESNVVTSSANEGNGTLRNVLFCIPEGETVTFDQPVINQSVLTSPLTIIKNVEIEGLSNNKPSIDIDFNTSAIGMTINAAKILTLDNVDITTINAGNKPTFVGPGKVNVIGNTKVKLQ